MKKSLITGISGFVGGFLTEHLVESEETSLFGTYLSEPTINAADEVRARVEFVQADLNDQHRVDEIIGSIKPDVIYHLAAVSSPSESFKSPAETISNNIDAQIHLLEAVREHGLLDTKILVVSSSEVYGMIDSQDIPVDEDTPLRPISPYGVSKIAQDYLGLQYFNAYSMPIYRVRPFNHIGPGQSPNFVVSAFAKQIAEIEKERREPIFKAGNLQAKRDFTDVRDVVRAYQKIIEKGKAGDVYNVGSGRALVISDILEKLLSLSDVSIRVEVEEELLRPSDIPEVVCDNAKVKELGWEPHVALEQSLRDTLEYWRNIL